MLRMFDTLIRIGGKARNLEKLAARNMKLDIFKMSKTQKVRRTFTKKVDFGI